MLEFAAEVLCRVNEHESVGASELARKMGLPKSTVHDYLKSLTTAGLLYNDGGKYRLSLWFFKYGGRTRKQMRIFDVVFHHVEDLATEIDDFSNKSLGVEEINYCVLLHKFDGKRFLQKAPVGYKTPLSWTSI